MMMRIISLVPNATEIVFALGAGHDLVGVSHECDHPAEARRLPQLTGSALPAELDPSEIDRRVSAQLANGQSLYTLDEGRIAALEPDLILTQELCPVCAVSTDQVDHAIDPLPRCPEVLSLDPKTLNDVFANIRTVGQRLGREPQAEALIAALQKRLDRVARGAAGKPRRRVVALEWLEPPFIAGHWVPEMIAAAGGLDVMGEPGEKSTRSTWSAVREADPDLLVVMPCGFDEDGARQQIDAMSNPAWENLRPVQESKAFPVDANGCFSRPGPRLIDGIETLVRIFHGVSVGLERPV